MTRPASARRAALRETRMPGSPVHRTAAARNSAIAYRRSFWSWCVSSLPLRAPRRSTGRRPRRQARGDQLTRCPSTCSDRRLETDQGRVPRRAAPALARGLARDVRLGFRALAPRAAVRRLGHPHSGARHRHQRGDVQRADAVVLRPLPYARPGELAILATHLIAQDRPDGTSLPNLFDWREQSASFAGMTFFRRTSVSQVTFREPMRRSAPRKGWSAPSSSSCSARRRSSAGRSRARIRRRERVVVLSEGVWQEQFGGSAAASDRRSHRRPTHTMIGVMPRTFQLPTSDTRLWRPISVLPSWPGRCACVTATVRSDRTPRGGSRDSTRRARRCR